MTNSTPNTQLSPTPFTDILFGTLAVLFTRGYCLGRVYSVGKTHLATGETRLAVLDLQGCPRFEVSFEGGRCVVLDPNYGEMEANPNDMLFEAARVFATLESAVPNGVADNTVPQYSPEHPNYPERS